jgi:hypothetical protein
VPAATLGSVHVGGKAVQVQPAGAAMDTNVVFAGVASVNVAVVAATDPVLVTTCVKVRLFPTTTGLGEAALVTVSSACVVVPTTVDANAVLLAELGSPTDELAVAVSTITVPLAVPVFTFTTIEKVAAVLAPIVNAEQTMLPVPPLPGLTQVQPAGAETETMVVFAGTASTNVTLSAALGPLLVTIWV